MMLLEDFADRRMFQKPLISECIVVILAEEKGEKKKWN
jgi:hypothetical protein